VAVTIVHALTTSIIAPIGRDVQAHSTDVQYDETDPICLKTYPAYERVLREVTAAWPRGTFSQFGAGEDIFFDDPDAVVAAVERVLPSP
jgi:hypothetical protein